MTPELGDASPASRAGVVIVGGSLAAAKTAQALRDRGYGGRVLLLSDEAFLPYDRPPLSKEFLAGRVGEEDLLLFDRSWYVDHDVDIHLEHGATGVDLGSHTVHVGSARVSYDELVIATGARPRQLPVDMRRTGVHVLRNLADARFLRAEIASARRAVVVGGGFIGFEVASTLCDRGLSVTLVEAAAAPLARSLDPVTAEALVDRATRTGGVDVRCATRLAALCPGPDERVAGAVLADGTRLAADLVVVGIGAIPNTEWLRDSGLTLSELGVHCDSSGRAAPNVWAVGDVSAWRGADGHVERHEHWTAANDQARIVAQNIVDGGRRTQVGPAYVWSDQFGLRINIVGNPRDHDEIRVLSRTPENMAVLYARGGFLVGACVVDQPRLMAQCRGWIARHLPVGDVPQWATTDSHLETVRSGS